MEFNAERAKDCALNIASLCEQYHARIIDHAEWSRRMRAAWSQVDMGELCIIGSACDRRTMAVKRQLGLLGLGY